MNFHLLHEAVAAVCPIHSVRVGVIADKSTWKIDFKQEATDEQRAAAQAVIDGYDTSDSADRVRQTSRNKKDALAKFSGDDDVSIAVRAGLSATGGVLILNDNVLVDKINEIIEKLNLDIQKLPKFQRASPQARAALFAAELQKE